MVHLMLVDQAFNQEEGYENPLKLEENWNKKYPLPLQVWYNNWEHLSTFFKYDAVIRKVIYTTNIVDGFHRQVHKVTKKGLRCTALVGRFRCFYLRLRLAQTRLLSGPKIIGEVDHALAQLALYFIPVFLYV